MTGRLEKREYIKSMSTANMNVIHIQLTVTFGNRLAK